jgi:hypothetical protein
MAHTVPLTCPACSTSMMITALACPHCETKVQGYFQTPGLLRLNSEQLQFVEVFLRCRGNIREVERDLKISYPTVRAKLDQVIQAMGYSVADAAPEKDVEDILDELDKGTLSFEEALKKLKEGESL